MRILVLSNTPWDNKNSFGNTFSNLFEGIQNIEIANIYCRYGMPYNYVVSRYFQITEKSLIKNLKNKRYPSGRELTVTNESTELESKEQKVFDTVRIYRLQIFFWIRDLIWKIGHWKSEELKKFIDDFSPDLIYLPLYYSNYLLDIGYFLAEYTGCKVVGHISDDIYTLKQFSLSPLYWIDRFIKRKKIRKITKKCEFIHVISEIQKYEYEKVLKKECRIFRKSMDFEGEFNEKKLNKPLQFVFTGNIGSGRWKSLAKIGEALSKINGEVCKAQLYIYTFTPISKKIKRALNIAGTVFLKSGVSSEDVIKIQKNADVLLHVESLKIKDRLSVHQSFSTKIVDYFHTANCIFAVGTKDTASIDYLIKNDAAIIASNKKEIQSKLLQLVSNTELIKEYGKKAWETGKKNHEKKQVSDKFRNEIWDVVK